MAEDKPPNQSVKLTKPEQTEAAQLDSSIGRTRGVRVPEMRKVELESFDHKLHSEMLRRWLRRPHVAAWWGDARQGMENAAQCGPETHAIIIADGRPAGYLCWQEPAQQELEAAGLADLPEGLVDIDILIGEPELLGLGIGSRALDLLLSRLRQDSVIRFAGLGTSVSNTRAIRAFERAGFRLFREFQDPEWGQCRYMVAEVRGATHQAVVASKLSHAREPLEALPRRRVRARVTRGHRKRR